MMHPLKPSKYTIKYRAFDAKNNLLKIGTVKSNELFASDLAAKVKLEDYLRKTLSGFNRMEVLRCEPDDALLNVATAMDDILNFLNKK